MPGAYLALASTRMSQKRVQKPRHRSEGLAGGNNVGSEQQLSESLPGAVVSWA